MAELTIGIVRRDDAFPDPADLVLAVYLRNGHLGRHGTESIGFIFSRLIRQEETVGERLVRRRERQEQVHLLGHRWLGY